MCNEKQPNLGSDELLIIETDWQLAQVNKNTLAMIAALKEQELFDEALRKAQEEGDV